MNIPRPPPYGLEIFISGVGILLALVAYRSHQPDIVVLGCLIASAFGLMAILMIRDDMEDRRR